MFGNINTHFIATYGTKLIYLPGDYSACYDKANEYYTNGFGNYNLFTNNCLHYVQKVLACANVSKGLKRIYKTPLIAPNAFGNAILLYHQTKSVLKKIEKFCSIIRRYYKVYCKYSKWQKIAF